MGKAKFRIEGMKELKKSLDKLGEAPQKHISSSSKKGMTIALKESRANAPYDTGMLKKGIILVGEKARVRGKKVYRIVFDSNMNDVFQKKNAEGKVAGYYPVSQEYGYFTKNGRYIPGYRFISDSLENNTFKIEKTIIDTMKKKIDAEIAKGGLK